VELEHHKAGGLTREDGSMNCKPTGEEAAGMVNSRLQVLHVFSRLKLIRY
jgi:hypothetical protein